MAAGLFGFVGYDIIRLIETLPLINKEAIEVPDSRLIRPIMSDNLRRDKK